MPSAACVPAKKSKKKPKQKPAKLATPAPQRVPPPAPPPVPDPEPPELPRLSPLLMAPLLRLEIPECNCEQKFIPLCLRTENPCPDFCAPGKTQHGPSCLCDCPLVPPVPCDHVFHADDAFFETAWSAELMEDEHPDALGIVLERWAKRLRRADPEEYAEPPDPPGPIVDQKCDARVAALSARWGDDRNRPRFALRHPRDMVRGDADEVRIECHRLRNGAIEETDLIAFDPEGDDAPGAAPERFQWDEFDLWRLAKAKEHLAKCSLTQNQTSKPKSRKKVKTI